MDWNIALLKGLRDFAVTVGAVALAAVFTYLSSTENLAVALAGFSVEVRTLLIPVLSALAVIGLNWVKHGSK